jgi:hypothetical protein
LVVPITPEPSFHENVNGAPPVGWASSVTVVPIQTLADGVADAALATGVIVTVTGEEVEVQPVTGSVAVAV